MQTIIEMIQDAKLKFIAARNGIRIVQSQTFVIKINGKKSRRNCCAIMFYLNYDHFNYFSTHNFCMNIFDQERRQKITTNQFEFLCNICFNVKSVCELSEVTYNFIAMFDL